MTNPQSDTYTAVAGQRLKVGRRAVPVTVSGITPIWERDIVDAVPVRDGWRDGDSSISAFRPSNCASTAHFAAIWIAPGWRYARLGWPQTCS